MPDRDLKIGFTGAGKVATALALGLTDAGYTVNAIASRSLGSAEKLAARLPSAAAGIDPQSVADAADLIFITTPDAAIPGVAASIKAGPGKMVCHTSAADPVDVLEPLRRQGAVTGVFHPLQSVGSIDSAAILPGITFAIESEEPLLGILRSLAQELGGRPVELSGTDRVLYHASAVMASNYLVTLLDLAAGLWKDFGTREQAVAALLPLVRGAIDNVETIGVPGCLTGPISRGDTGTVNRHLAALRGKSPRALDVYRVLGLNTIPLAVAKGGIDTDQAAIMKELLEINL
ncbi:DUF2520 domain-containing protein [Dehalogenimonas sp. THU2]|uniref:Rossmann-like and DUF2520 domain-containing protein n=1 Tax=Dehalogenimonas sp. THU2 TaxID=3151121 RepID=UPI003218B33E